MIQYKRVGGEWVAMSDEEVKEYWTKYNIATAPHIQYFRLEPGEILLK